MLKLVDSDSILSVERFNDDFIDTVRAGFLESLLFVDGILSRQRTWVGWPVNVLAFHCVLVEDACLVDDVG